MSDFLTVGVWEHETGSTWRRKGYIPNYTGASVETRHLAAGPWSLAVPYGALNPRVRGSLGKSSLLTFDHGAARRTTGMVTSLSYASDDNGQPVLTASGVDALAILGGYLIYPEPGAAKSTTITDQGLQMYLLPQGVSHYTDSGPAEDVLTRVVSVQTRRVGDLIDVAPSQGRGRNIDLHERFKALLPTVVSKCQVADLGVRVGLVSDNPASTTARLVCEFYAPVDRSARVKLTSKAGTIGKWTQADNAPTSTRLVIGGNGKGVGRWFYTLAARPAVEASWLWPRETFLDARDTDQPEVMFQRGVAAFATSAAQSSFSLESAEAEGIRYGKPFEVGDYVTVSPVDGLSQVERLNAVVLSIGSDGPKVQLIPGNPDGTDPSFRQAALTRALRARLANLEQEDE